MSSSSIESVLTETRSFAPAKEFAAAARVGSMAEYEKLYRRADEDPEGFWAETGVTSRYIPTLSMALRSSTLCTVRGLTSVSVKAP